MRRLVLALSIGFVATFLCAAGHSAPQRAFSDADGVELNRVSAYLNSIHTMKGGFVQIGPDGQIDQGEFALSKPGRIRFQYYPPTPTLIVSDGSTVAVENTRLKTVDRYPLSDTPLGLILGDNIDLLHDREIVGIEREQDAVVIKARSSSNRTQANITLTFAEPELELRQWTVVDNQGLTTTVALRNMQTGVTLPGSLFTMPDRNPFARKRDD